MIELYLILTGVIFFIWLFALVRQTQRGFVHDEAEPPRPVVPVQLTDVDEAIVVAEGRGRIIYANPSARRWFHINGGAPNLALMTQMIQPADTLHDLLADTGSANFRLGQRQIEAVSHAIPSGAGQRMVVVMRERHAAARQSVTEFDPLRALAILDDMSKAVSADQSLATTTDAILRCIAPSVSFDCGEITLWDATSEHLRPTGRAVLRLPTGALVPPPEPGEAYAAGEGFSGWVAMYRQPLMVGNIPGRTDVLPHSFHGNFQSYLGVPLTIGPRFIGTLEIVHRERDAFTQRDVALLQSIAGQVAATVEAARLYEDQSERIDELGGLQQIAQAMSQLGEPRELYAQLTQRIAALMDVELCGVLFYSEDDRTFRSQPPFYGVPDSLIRHYQVSVVPDTEMYSIWHHKPYWFSNNPTPEQIHTMGFEDIHSALKISAFALVPMIVGARRTGLLLVANKHTGQGFGEDEMHALMSFAGQAAVVSENARLYTEEQRRNRELGGLQQIAQAMGVLRDPDELYGQITQRIAELMGVQMCGVLLYDARSHVLVSQRPFFGLEDEEAADFYQIPSPPGGVVSGLWQDRDTWYSNDLRRDTRVANTDLTALAGAMNINQMVIAPLVVGGNRLGIIQAANKLDGGDFSEGDARILAIFAGQAAILIDNARLYREMQRRTHEAEGLRAITEIASQIAPQSEMVESVLIAIANLMEARFVTVGLVEEGTGHLVIAPSYAWGGTLRAPYRIETYTPGFEHSVLVSRRPFITNDARSDERVLPVYHRLLEEFAIENAVQVPLVLQDRSIGELTVANRAHREFTIDDVHTLQAIATQVAAMIDRMRLYQATDQDLRARVQELDALSRVGHELSQTLELNHILDVIRQEALRSTDATAVSVLLLTPRYEWPAPDQPHIEQRYGETRDLRALAPIERTAILRNDVIQVDDYAVSEYEATPDKARSALVVPIRFGDEVAGALHLYSPQTQVFNADVIDFVLALTDQATTALGNARRYQEQLRANEQLRIRADRMGRIFDLGEMFRAGASLTELLEEVAHSIQETVGFNIVLINLVDERENVLRRTAQAGLPLPIFEEMQKISPPVEQALGLMRPENKISGSYFYPAEGSQDVIADLPVVTVAQERGRGPQAWDPEDLLIVPLYGSGGRFLGLMSVDEPRSGRRPDAETVAALEIFASQAAFNIENYRLVERIQQEAEATRRERDRLAQLHLVASEIQSAPDVPSRLQVVADGIHDAGWGQVVITLRDEHLDPTALIHAGFEREEADELSERIEPGSLWNTWINDLAFYDLKLGAGYYLRYDHPWVVANLHGGSVPEPRVAADEWHPADVLFLPLMGQDQQRIIGIISMKGPVDGRVPTEASLQPFELFASQAAAAIETTRLYLETVRAAEQEQRINEVMEVVSGSLSPEAVIEAVGRGLQQTVPFTRMSVVRFNSTTDQFDVLRADLALDGSVSVVADDPLPVDGTALGVAFRENRSAMYRLEPDRRARARYADLATWHAAGERATLIVPMVAGGTPIGALRLGTELENAFGFEDNRELIQRLANLSAVSMENARLFAETQQRSDELGAQARRLALLNRVATQLAAALTPQEIYRIALDELQEVVGADYGGVLLYELDDTRDPDDPVDAALLVLDTHPAASTTPRAPQRVDLRGNVIAADLRRTLQPVAVPDVAEDDRLGNDRDVLHTRGTASLLVVPLITGGQAIGSIGLDFTAPHAFNPAELELARTIASQVSVTLEKANLLTETEDRARALDEQAQRLAALNRLSERLAETLDPIEAYRVTLHGLQDALNCQSAGLMLFQGEDTSRLVLSTHPMDQGAPSMELSLSDNPIAQYILETRQPFVAEDIPNDPRYEGLHESFEARNTRAMLIVPVTMGEHVLGTIGLDSERPRVFSDAEVQLATTSANQAAVAIEKARLFTEAQQRAVELDEQAQRMALVNRISTRLAETLDAQTIYEVVLGELVQAFEVQTAGLVLIENNAGRLVLSYPFEAEQPDITIPIEGNRSVEIVMRTHKALVSSDVLTDPVFEPAWGALRERGVKAIMLLPLVVGDQVIGTIGLDAHEARSFTEAEIGLAETIVSQAALAIEKARLYDETLGLTIFNQAVVESIQQGIVVLDMNLNIARVNRFMTERYGWDPDAVGQNLFSYRPDYAEFLREPVAVALGMSEPQTRLEVERQDAAGNASIRNYYIYPMREGRTVTGIVLLVEDVTERARLEADLETRAVQMAALTEVSSQITSTLDPDQVSTLILDALDRVVPYDGVSLWLRAPDREELRIVAARGYADADATDANELVGLEVEIAYSPLFREMAENAQVVNVGDISAGDARFPYGSAAVYKNWLGAPLISKGRVVGVLTLEKREEHFYTPLHEQLALTFANQAAVALDNAQMFQETRDRALALDEQARRLALLNRVSLALAQTLDLENILEIALRETAIALDVDEGAALQIDGSNHLASVVVEFPRGDAPPSETFDLTRNQSIDRVRTNLIPLVVERIDNDPFADDLRALMRLPDVQSTLVVPLVVGGNVIGILRLDSPEQRAFTLEQVELAQTIASQAAIAMQNAALFEQASIRTNELETLFESAQATAVTLDLDEVSRRVTIQMLTALQADACTIFLWDDVGDTLTVRGDISARPEEAPPVQIGDVFTLSDFPLRERALRDRELKVVRVDDPDLPPSERELIEQHNVASRMLIPLVVNEVSIGLVEMETVDPNRYFRAETVRLARTLASQAAISIENARLQTETRRTVEEMYIINDMSSALSSANSLDQLLTVIDAQLPSLTDAQVLYVATYAPATEQISFPLALEVRTDESLDMPDRPLGADEFSAIIRQRAPLLLAGDNLPDVQRSLGIETIMPDARCFLGVPLMAGDEVIGVLAVRDDDDALAFSHNDQRILTTVGGQLAVSIQSTRLFEQTLQLAEELDQRVQERTAELEQERQHIGTLYGITTELATSLDMERLLSRALEMVADAVGATQGAILAVDSLSDRLYFRAKLGWPEVSGDEAESVALNEGLAGWVVQNRQNLVIDNVQRDPRWMRLGDADDVPRAAMVALIEANEDILGVTMLYSERVGAFNQEHLRLVTAASSQVANAMNNAELYSLIRDQAERLGVMLRQEQVEATKSSAILESVADGVMVADANGQIIVFNSTAERILRLPAENVVNQPTGAIGGLYSAAHGQWAQRIEEWTASADAYEPGTFLEDRVTLDDDRVISVRLSPVYMGDQFLGTVSIFRDITREVEVDRLKSEFVATVSHELRTPMTSIKGYADLLLLGAAGMVSEQQARFLETIKQNADRLSILVNDLLDISRIDQGRMELKFTEIPVRDLLETTAEHIQGRATDERRPMNVELRTPEHETLTVWGDHDKVAQVMTNLADNAFNYTDEDGTITLGAVHDEATGHTLLSITDTGIGISPEVGERIFERFFRGDETHDLVMDTPGTGLGLAIVKELVTAHNGVIWFESEEGVGTTFYVSLPAQAPVTVSGEGTPALPGDTPAGDAEDQEDREGGRAGTAAVEAQVE